MMFICHIFCKRFTYPRFGKVENDVVAGHFLCVSVASHIKACRGHLPNNNYVLLHFFKTLQQTTYKKMNPKKVVVNQNMKNWDSKKIFQKIYRTLKI